MTPDRHLEAAHKLLADQTASHAALRSAIAHMKAAQRFTDTQEQLADCLSQRASVSARLDRRMRLREACATREWALVHSKRLLEAA
jgi:hypothetical protein